MVLFRAFLFHSIAHLFHLIDVELRTSQGIWSSKSPSLFFCLLFIACFSTVRVAKASSNTRRFLSFSCMLSAPSSPRQGRGWMTSLRPHSLAPLQSHQQVHAVTLLRIPGASKNYAGRLYLSQLILTENKTPKQWQPQKTNKNKWAWHLEMVHIERIQAVGLHHRGVYVCWYTPLRKLY